MPHTNAKHWFWLLSSAFVVWMPSLTAAGSPGPLEKMPWVVFENFFSWGVRWDNDDAATITCQAAQDIPLDPKVNHNCERFRNSCLVVGLNSQTVGWVRPFVDSSCLLWRDSTLSCWELLKPAPAIQLSRISVEMPPLIAPTTRILRVRAAGIDAMDAWDMCCLR